MRVTESQSADDVALYATSWDSFESVAAEFVKVALSMYVPVTIHLLNFLKLQSQEMYQKI